MKTAVYDRFKRIKNGQESLEDVERSGRPSSSLDDETIGKIRNLVRSERRSGRIQDMATILGISHGLVQNILKDDLGMRRIFGFSLMTQRQNYSHRNSTQQHQGQKKRVLSDQN